MPARSRSFRPLVALLGLLAVAASGMVLDAARPFERGGRAQSGSVAAPSSGAQATLPLVPVNVRVLDRAGKLVTDLTQADFTLTEDDAPQPVRHFSLQTPTTEPADPAMKPVVRTAVTLSPQPARMLVIFLGRGRLEDASKAVTALAQFVRTKLVPQDLVAVFTGDRALPFTTDHEKAAQVLDRFKRAHGDIDHEIELQLGPTTMAALYGRKVIPAKLQTKIDEVVDGPGARTPAGTAPDVLEPKDFSNLSLDDFMFSTAHTLQDQGSLNTLVEYLRRFAGEKHVIYVTEKGMPLPSEENDARVAAGANDGRIVIHTIQAGGMMQPEAGKEMEQTHLQTLAFKSLRTLAGLTGGLAIFGETGSSAVARIEEATRSSYLLGYQPRGWNGAYRKIAVKVNRPDVTVLWRHGYYAQTQPEPFNRRGIITADRLLAAAVFRREVKDIRLKVAASQANGGLKIDVKIDPSRLSIATGQAGRTATLHVAVFCLDSGEQSTGANQQELVMKMSEEEYSRYQKDWIPYTLQFPLSRGADHIRFIVYDYGADVIGRADTKIF